MSRVLIYLISLAPHRLCDGNYRVDLSIALVLQPYLEAIVQTDTLRSFSFSYPFSLQKKEYENNHKALATNPRQNRCS